MLKIVIFFSVFSSFAFGLILLDKTHYLSFWDKDKLGGKPSNFEKITLEDLINRNVVGQRKRACISEINDVGHFVWDQDSQFNSQAYFVPGTTYWLNEWMFVGHAIYDLHIIQLLRTLKLDRIILQRTQCNYLSCINFQTWKYWFRGYYTSALISAGYDHLPFYIRHKSNDTHWKPHVIGHHHNSTDVTLNQIPANNVLCFENVLYSTGLMNFHNNIELDAVLEFKKAAYSMLKKLPEQHQFSNINDPMKNDKTKTNNNNNTPIKIIVFDRAEEVYTPARFILEPKNFIDYLILSFPAPKYNVKLQNIIDMPSFEKQVYMMADATVAIAMYGSFMSNIVYMQPGSLFIALCGNYTTSFSEKDHLTYSHLAHDFLVYYKNITITDFTYYHQANINIIPTEYDLVKNIISEYLNNTLS